MTKILILQSTQMFTLGVKNRFIESGHDSKYVRSQNGT